jgi:hypothetical protein
MKLSPEMIDAAVIQLRTVFEHNEEVPADVKEAGTIFLDKLDAWSERMKKGEAVTPTVQL